MTTPAQAVAKVAQKLEELSLDHELGELQDLADELGAITIPEVDVCKGKCPAAQDMRRTLEELGMILVRRGGIDPRRLEEMAYRSRYREMSAHTHLTMPVMDPKAFLSVSGP